MFVHCVNKFLHFLTENQHVLQLHKIESMSEWSVRKSHNRPRSEAARIENVFDQGHDFTGVLRIFRFLCTFVSLLLHLLILLKDKFTRK